MSSDSFLKARASQDLSQYDCVNVAEALAFAKYTLDHWQPASDTYILRYGSAIPTLVSAATALAISNRILAREMIRMRFGAGVIIRAAVAVPSSFASFMFHKFVTHDILLGETPCPICVQVRSASYQVMMGFALGGSCAVVVSQLALMTFSNRKVPEFFSRNGLVYLRNLALKSKGLLVTSLLVHLVTGFGLSILEQRSWWSINEELKRRLEREKIVV